MAISEVDKLAIMSECTCPACTFYRTFKKNNKSARFWDYKITNSCWAWHKYCTENYVTVSILENGQIISRKVSPEDIGIITKASAPLAPVVEKKELTSIFITTRFVAFHNWSNAPLGKQEYLRRIHRHEFHVRLSINVKDDDRDIEFCELKERVDKWIAEHYTDKKLWNKSCEMMCKELAIAFDAQCVEVSEDGENGARYWKNF